MGNGLRNSISYGEPERYVIQLRLGVRVLRKAIEKKQTHRKKEDVRPNSGGA